MSWTTLKVEGGDVLGTLRSFLGRLLEAGFVDAVMVPKALPGADGYVQSLVSDPAMLKDANPMAPTMAVQTARVLSEVAGPSTEGRIGVVLKPCEMRALVELAKFLQVKLEDVVTIGVDCLGTYEVKDFAELAEAERASAERALVDAAKGGGAGDVLREACRICEYPAPAGADITLGVIGAPSAGEVVLIVGERFEKELGEKLSLRLEGGEPAGRADAVRKIAQGRAEARKAVLGEMRGSTASLEGLLEAFSTCIRCHNCMNVCPICYCKECVFRSPVFEHKAAQLLKLAGRKGAIRMPADTLIFHLTRLSHMGTSCVGCGMCDSACPSGLPVSRLFNLVGGELQAMFDYVPGADPGEEVPVSAFREKELEATAGEHA